MARRRRHRRSSRRRNPINKADWTPIIIGALGGAAAIYLYLKPQLSGSTAPSANTVSITTPTLPATNTTVGPSAGS
jgi:hypothetical protein